VPASAKLSITRDVKIKAKGEGKLVREDGGTMFTVSAGTLTLKNVVVDGNKIEATGAMINVTTDGTLNIEDGAKLSNALYSSRATKNGIGAVSVIGGNLNMNGGEISNNELAEGIDKYNKSNGGVSGAAIFESNGAQVNISGGLINGNHAFRGGAIFNDNSKLIISGGTISNNSSEGYGGAIFNAGTFNMTDGTISNNSTCNGTGIGGGVYNGCRIIGNEEIDSVVMTQSGGKIINNAAFVGAGVYNEALATYTLNGGSVSSNGSSATTNGGGICNNGTLNIAGGNVSNNQAQTGGGVYNNRTGYKYNKKTYSDAEANISGGSISDNVSVYYGGAVYNIGDLNISGGELSSNTAGFCGGGIYNWYDGQSNYGIMNFSKGSIINNNAKYYGGGLYNYGVCTIDSGNIEGNTSGSASPTEAFTGSAIYLVRDVKLSSAANIKGDCFVYFDTYCNIILKDNFKGHDTINISVPTDKAQYPSYEGYQVIKPASGYTLTSDDLAVFQCVGNGDWALKLLPIKEQPVNKMAARSATSTDKTAGKDGTIVLWTKKTVTYKANGGVGSDKVDSILRGDSYTILENMFSKDGSRFIGWNTSQDGSGTSYSTGKTIDSMDNSLTLYAQWSKNIDPTPSIQSTTYKVVANYYTSTDNGKTYKQDNASAVTLKGETAVNVGDPISAIVESTWNSYGGNNYGLVESKSTMNGIAVIDPESNVLTLNYYRTTANGDGGNKDNNNTDNNKNNGGGSDTPSNNTNNGGGSSTGTAVNVNSNAPDTGDTSDAVLWTSLGLTSMVLAGVMISLRRKEEK
jgi:uncharacterized repeat protein (TIGR02543 family)